MDAAGIVAIVLAVLGLAGSFAPVLPGPPLSWCALLSLYFSKSPGEPFTMTALLVWLAVFVVLTVLDYVLPAKFTKMSGGHKASERGALIGMFAGIFLTPVGMVAGSFIGAFLGEYLFEKQDAATSLKIALWSFVAFILTTGLKAIAACIVIWQVLAHLF